MVSRDQGLQGSLFVFLLIKHVPKYENRCGLELDFQTPFNLTSNPDNITKEYKCVS